MKKIGLRNKLGRKWRNISYPEYTLRIIPNHLNRRFTPDGLGNVCVSDITYIHTTHGFRYLTCAIDLYDRRTVGCSLSSTLTASDTSVRAYRMAVRSRKPQAGMIFHSDCWVQYAPEEFRYTLDRNIVRSMSRKGNCLDNAVGESIFKSLKCELIYGDNLLTPEQL